MLDPETSLTVRAYAKINWTLELLGQRPDGYHEVRTILQNVSVWDRITVTATPNPEVTVQCADPRVPTGPANLCHRAAILLQQAAAVPSGAQILIEKDIPLGAGMGGGSSDAAATLAALNRIWGIHWPLEKLTALAAQVGADVPFFLVGGTALGTGRGDQIQPLPGCQEVPLLLLEAPFELATATVYGQVQGFRADAGERTARLEELLRASRSWEEIVPLLINDLEEPAGRLCPEVRTRLSELRQADVLAAGMSGSGPTLFALLPEAGCSHFPPWSGGWRLRQASTVDRGWETEAESSPPPQEGVGSTPGGGPCPPHWTSIFSNLSLFLSSASILASRTERTASRTSFRACSRWSTASEPTNRESKRYRGQISQISFLASAISFTSLASFGRQGKSFYRGDPSPSANRIVNWACSSRAPTIWRRARAWGKNRCRL